MTSARLRELLPVLEAYEQGKEVEWSTGDRWCKWGIDHSSLCGRNSLWIEMQHPNVQWRIKPEERKPREWWMQEIEINGHIHIDSHQPLSINSKRVTKVREVL